MAIPIHTAAGRAQRLRIGLAIAATAGLLACLPVLADEAIDPAADQLFSGPQPGEKLPALKVRRVYGEGAGQVVDVTAVDKDRLLLLVIVSGSNRPAASVTRALLNFAEMQTGRGLDAALVMLAADATTTEHEMRQAVAWWGAGLPVGISVDGAEGPGSYGLNRNVNLTVLLAHEGRVLANTPLVQPSVTDVPAILKAVARQLKIEVPSAEVCEFLSMPTRQLPGTPWKTAPTDPELRRKLCDLIGAAAEDRDRPAAEIEDYVGQDIARQRELLAAADALGNTYNKDLKRSVVAT